MRKNNISLIKEDTMSMNSEIWFYHYYSQKQILWDWWMTRTTVNMFITSYSITFQRKCKNCYCIYLTAIWIKNFGKLRILLITPNLILISQFSKVFLETNQQKIKNFPYLIEIVWDKNILFLIKRKISNDKKRLKNSPFL